MKRPMEAGVVGDGEELKGFRGVVGWRCSSVQVGLVGSQLCLCQDLILGLTLKNPSNRGKVSSPLSFGRGRQRRRRTEQRPI